jgi:hypothetical protein
MKKLINTLLVVVVLMPLMLAMTSTVKASPGVTFELINPPAGGLLELDIDESHTFEIKITSDEPFVIAMVMTDAYYPGRGVFWHGGDRATHDTEATLHVTIKGKNSTSELFSVCGWPEPGICWPDGVAPVSITAGVRYRGGIVVARIFSFAVTVP